MADKTGIELGARIRHLRERAGLTQERLAKLSLKSVETISNFERGRTIPSVRTLSQLARHLNCALADFFTAKAPGPLPIDPWILSLSEKAKLLDRRERRLFLELLDMIVKGRNR